MAPIWETATDGWPWREIQMLNVLAIKRAVMEASQQKQAWLIQKLVLNYNSRSCSKSAFRPVLFAVKNALG